MTDFETHPIGTAKRIDEMEARLAKADVTALLREARADLAAYVNEDYPEGFRAKYPDVQRKWERDMELCRRIDAALAALKGNNND